MTRENKGYSLILTHDQRNQSCQATYLKPMSLYVPEIAARAVNNLLEQLNIDEPNLNEGTLTVTNNNNGVSVDQSFSRLAMLQDPAVAAEAVKELINIVRGYESDEESNVCGW